MNPTKTYSIPVTIFKDGRYFIAYTPALDLSSAGKTAFQAKKMFLEAVDAFFAECISMGTLDSVLRDLGWTKNRRGFVPPRVIKHDVLTVDIHQMV